MLKKLVFISRAVSLLAAGLVSLPAVPVAAQSPFQEVPAPATRKTPAHTAPARSEEVPAPTVTTLPPPQQQEGDWCVNAKLKPNDIEARANCLNDQAMSSIKGSNAALALDLANQAVQLAPNSPYHRDTRGEAYLALGRMNEAMQDFEQSIALGGDFAITYLSRGKIFEARGDREKAIADYRRSLQAPASDDIERDAQQQARAKLQVLGVH